MPKSPMASSRNNMAPINESKPFHATRPSLLSYQLLLTIVVVVVFNVAFLQSNLTESDGPGGRKLSDTMDKTRSDDVEMTLPFNGKSDVTISPASSKTVPSALLNPQNTSNHNAYSPTNPYYLHGKTSYKHKKFHHRKSFDAIVTEDAISITDPAKEKVWILPDPIQRPTRNHESLLLEYDGYDHNTNKSKQILVNVLGRYSRVVQWMDLQTGQQCYMETSGMDPDDRPLNDLNHVASVLVDNLDNSDKKEIWLPCGFHNDRIGKEQSTNYVRIIDVDTMRVRLGPKLPYSGGACGAAPIQAIPGEAPLICAFGGTDGNHDTGIFLPYISCYDRTSSRWVYPFGKLPVGMDHLSVTVVPKSACHPQDPARVLLFNFRTKNYSTHSSAEILAFDIPAHGWTRDELDNSVADTPGRWYTFANHTFEGASDEIYAPRDASAVVMANMGRSVINFGGINQVRNPKWKKGDKSSGPKVFSTWYSTIRELNVCDKTWRKVADMGIETFAVMASASTKLNSAFFCGGAMYRQDFNGNTQWCLAVQIPGIVFWNHRLESIQSFHVKKSESGTFSSISTTTD